MTEKTPLDVRLTTMAVIIAPLLGVVAAITLMWNSWFHWADLALMSGMYVLTGLGISVGFHRLFVHRSFETYKWVKFVMAVAGSMSLQGSLFKWVAIHRRHHQCSDTPDDPHSPRHEDGVLGTLGGFWHAHIGWFFVPDPPNLYRYVKDLEASPSLCAADRLWPLWAAIGFAIPALLGWLAGGWVGALTGFVWGGLVRVFLIHHVTWSVNSACHLWGSQAYESDDMSRNNVVFGVLGMGEGWHNNHHAFPSSARHGLRWWQIDASYWAIRALSLLCLAWGVKEPVMK